jgi:GH35 family endo-1,4-beta-xylanase
MKRIVTALLLSLFLVSCISTIPAVMVINETDNSAPILLSPTTALIASLTPTIVPTIVPSPTVEPKMEDLPQTKAAVDQFVAAMKAAGVQVDADQIRQRLTTKEITRKDGKKYEITLTKDGYPLMVKNEGEEWAIATARISETLLNGLRILAQVDEDTPMYTSPKYAKIAGEYFGGLYTNGPYFATHIENIEGTYASADAFRRMADQYKSQLVIHPGIDCNSVPNELKNADASMVKEYVKKLTSYYLKHVTKIDTGTPPTVINFANEAVWATVDHQGWEDNAYYDAYGDRLIIDVYEEFYRQAADYDLTPGKDFILVYNDYNLYENSQKSNYAFKVLSEAKKQIAKDLNIPENNVQLDIGMQMRMWYGHTDKNKSSYGHYPVPTQEEFFSKLKKFSSIGRIHISEVSLVNSPNEQMRIQILNGLIKIAIQSGLVDSIGFEGVMDFQKYKELNGETSAAQVNLVDSNYKPTINYYELLKLLYELGIKERLDKGASK